ncbi:hypothetical protein JTB14_019693 [Gonioctena quinquepunctata]|nr:hypothetical protein JTB14_019693 [Gonioctena quinquepunctata]
MCPLSSFGLLFGEFLASIDDETRATSIMTSTFVAVMSFTGIASSYMLRKYSIKAVSFVGALSYTLGSLTNIFNTNVTHLVISYSILKGFGFGLLLAASFTIVNSYFDKKHNFVMGICQTIIGLGTILCAPLMAYIVKEWGYVKTLIFWMGLSLLNFPAIATFHAVDKYLRKEPFEASQKSGQTNVQVEPLLQAEGEKATIVVPTLILSKEKKISVTVSTWRRWLL